MVRKILAAFILMTAFALTSSAQIRFAYDVNFDFRFDNREYDRSGFQSSVNLFGARLAPSDGYDARVGNVSHRLMAASCSSGSTFSGRKKLNFTPMGSS